MTRYDVFLKVVETGSFTRAAEQLGYSQSAVSQMVRTLEQELGAVLIDRAKNGAAMTPDGRTYYPYIRGVSVAARSLEEKRRELQGLNRSVIRIGTFTSVSRNWLPERIRAFRRRYPAAQFVLQQGEYTSIERWIKEGSVDFGFVSADAVSGLEVTPLYRDEMLAVLPPEHPLAARERVTLAELAAEPFILLDEGERSVPLEAFARAELRPDVQFKVYDDYSILPMVRQGLGVSVLYATVVRGIAEGVALRPVEPAVERTVALAWRDGRTMTVAARRFAENVLEKFGGAGQARTGGGHGKASL